MALKIGFSNGFLSLFMYFIYLQHLRIDDCEELEVSEVSDYCSTAKESETCHTEQGYEADSEFTPDENCKRLFHFYTRNNLRNELYYRISFKLFVLYHHQSRV